MFCEKCGAELPKGAHFCDKCGANVEIGISHSVHNFNQKSEDSQKETRRIDESSNFLKKTISKPLEKSEPSKKISKKPVLAVIFVVIAFAIAASLSIIFLIIKPFNDTELTKYDSYTEEEFIKETGIEKEWESDYFYFNKDVKVELFYNSASDFNYATYIIDGDPDNPTDEQKQFSIMGLRLGTNYEKAGVEKMLLNKGFQLAKKDSANLFSDFVANGPLYIFETPKQGKIYKRIAFYVSDKTGEITSKIRYDCLTVNHTVFDVSYILSLSGNEDNDSKEEYSGSKNNYDNAGPKLDNSLNNDIYSIESINPDEEKRELYILPDSNKYLLTTKDLEGLSPQELTYARNEIYARYGYVFQSPELNNYFAGKKWYYPNSNVNQSALSKLEQQNADFIRQYQDSTGKQYIPNGKETENRNETKNSNIGYSDNELINMARKFYEKTTGHRAPSIIEIDSVTGNNVNIHLYEFIGEPGEEHISTTDWYSVDRYTGKGTNVIGDQIDLTKEF